MDIHIPDGMLRNVQAPKPQSGKPKKNRLRLMSGDQMIDVLDLWDDGFALPCDGPQPERGFVDLFDGARHIRHGLAYQTGMSGERNIYAFKLGQDPRMVQPADFARAPDGPVALIATG